MSLTTKRSQYKSEITPLYIEAISFQLRPPREKNELLSCVLVCGGVCRGHTVGEASSLSREDPQSLQLVSGDSAAAATEVHMRHWGEESNRAFTHDLTAFLCDALLSLNPPLVVMQRACFHHYAHTRAAMDYILPSHQTSSIPLCVLCLPVRKQLFTSSSCWIILIINNRQQESSGRNSPRLMINK